MDPNANLKEQSELLEAQDRADISRRAELRRALLEWLCGGGYAPDWTLHPAAAKAYKRWRSQSAKFQDLTR